MQGLTCGAVIYKGCFFLGNEVRNYSNSPCSFEAVTTCGPDRLCCIQDRCSGAAVAVACINRGVTLHKAGRLNHGLDCVELRRD